MRIRSLLLKMPRTARELLQKPITRYVLPSALHRGCGPLILPLLDQRLRSTLRQCARDWSDTVSAHSPFPKITNSSSPSRLARQGKAERESTYTPILEALNRTFSSLTPAEK